MIGVVVFPVGIGYFIPAGVGTFRGEVARNNPQVLESVHAVGDVIGVIFFPIGVAYFIPAGGGTFKGGAARVISIVRPEGKTRPFGWLEDRTDYCSHAANGRV